MNRPVRFLHLSDTHIGETKDTLLQEVKPYPFTRSVIDEIKKLPFDYDFIIHTGDIAAVLPKPEIYQMVEKMFQEIKKPIYYVTGNHDDSPHIKKYLTMGQKEDLDDSLLTYTFDIQDTRFMGIDARGPDEIDPHGQLSERQLTIVEDQLKATTKPMVFFIHYPAIKLDTPWIDRDMLILNGDTLHSLFATYSEKVSGVFFGHIHRTVSLSKDNVNYYSVGSTCIQFRNYPEDTDVHFVRDNMSRMNVVSIENNQISIKNYLFACPPKES